jgi:hypothetical protein
MNSKAKILLIYTGGTMGCERILILGLESI